MYYSVDNYPDHYHQDNPDDVYYSVDNYPDHYHQDNPDYLYDHYQDNPQPTDDHYPMQEDNPCENAGCYHYCNVANGDAQCGCYRGYRLYKNRRSCVDIDECSKYESGGCYHYCHNTLGSYYCLCEIGYYLNDDGLSCSHGDAIDTFSPPLYPKHRYPNPSYQNPPQVPNIPYQRYPAYRHQPVYPDHQIPLSQQGHPSNEVPYGHQAPEYPDHQIPLSQGEHDKVFNLISNPDVHINALFIPDAKREEVTWIGSLGIVTHPQHSGRGNWTYISFSTDNSSITITHLFGKGEDKQWRTVSLKSTPVSSISLTNGEMRVTHRTGSTKQPTVEVTLSDVKFNFTAKFVGSHLDMFWQEVGEQPELSHGLIGQFYRQGVEIDGVRKMLMIPHKEPLPIMRRPISKRSFMERENDAMNSGFQGHGLIDGNYLNYKVSDLFSTDFSPANVHHRQHGRKRKV